MMSRRWRRVRILTPGVTILTLLVVSGCSTVGPAEFAATGQQQPTDWWTTDSPEPNSGGDDVSSLKVGDCTMGSGTDTEVIEVTEVTIVPCDQPHVDEYHARITVDGDTYPGDDALQAQAETDCVAQFEAFVGIAYEDSQTLWFSYIYPTQFSWQTTDNREILCAVFEAGVLTTGSLQGAAR